LVRLEVQLCPRRFSGIAPWHRPSSLFGFVCIKAVCNFIPALRKAFTKLRQAIFFSRAILSASFLYGLAVLQYHALRRPPAPDPPPWAEVPTKNKKKKKKKKESKFIFPSITD
jgi:hypothetical protein